MDAKKLLKRKLFNLNPQLAQYEEALSLQEKLDKHLIRVDGVEKLKGDKGETGEPGYTPIKGKDYFTSQEVDTIVSRAKPVKGVDYFTNDEAHTLIQMATPVKGVDYKDGEKGDQGIPGMPGKPGEDGQNAEPETPESIATKLNTLEDVLDLKVLKGGVKSLSKQINYNDIQGKPNMADLRWHGGGLSKATTDGVTITGDGTPGNPLVGVAGGVTKFTELTDVPNSYASAAGKGVRVNGSATGLEFYTTTDSDEKVKYDAADTSAGYLGAKTVAGTGITLSEGTGGDADKLVITNTNPTPYSLPTASASVLGGIKVGTRLSINGSGVLSADATDLSAYSTKTQADLLYLGIGAKAADSDLLDGHDTAYFQVAGSYLTDAPSDGNTYGRKNGAWSAVTAGGGDMVLNASQSVTGLKTFDKDMLAMKGTSTGVNTISVANTSATSYTNILPARDFTFDNITTGTTTNGTGFLKGNGTVISFDNSTYLTSVGTGVANELTYWSGTNTLGSLATATYPSLTELSYVKGVTSGIQAQLNAKGTGNGDMLLGIAQSVTETKTFTKDKLLVKGTSTGTTNLTTANTSATSYTATFPAKDGTVAMTSDIVSQVEDSITDGHTTIAPSGNSVYDALLLKASLVANTFTGLQTLATGTTTLAPLKFVAGTNLTTAVAGTIEFDGTDLFISI
jgi:hypothetical protein